MISRWTASLCLLALPLTAGAQTSSHPVNAATHKTEALSAYSAEPFVIEQYVTIARFENDGTGEEELRVRVRLQSDASVEQWNQLAIGYNAASETLQVRYARVQKADGTTVNVGADAIKDGTASAAADFAAFSNCREKRVSIPSLAPGDTLEYAVDKLLKAPEAPGEFWLEHRFVDSAMVLDEQLEINIPSGRAVTLKSSTAYEKQQRNGRAIYRWKRTHLKRDGSVSQDSSQTKPADVLLTTFRDWNEVARWYAKRVEASAEASATIRSKTLSLISDQKSDLNKAEAIFEYIAKNLRNVDISFGANGYQPRTATGILSSQFGDSADKSVLLAAMFHAAGFEADTVLIPSGRRLDPGVPSPAQFDRVLTIARVDHDLIWLNPGMDVVPFRMIPAGLRAKSALLISADGSGRIIETPADPPFRSIQRVDIDAQMTPLGRLTGHVHYSVRGDTEIVLRSAFHGAPEARWNEIAQTILTLDGIRGRVTSAKCSDPTDTRNPFQLDIDFTQLSFLTWSNVRTSASVPLLRIGLPDPPGDVSKPIELGSPLTVSLQLTLRLPDMFTARAPAALTLTRDFAGFNSTYTFAGHIFTAKRSVDFKMRQLAASRRDEYLAFERAVSADQSQLLSLENTTPGGPVIPVNASADDLAEAGHAALSAGNSPAAIPLLERAVELNPQHKQAWIDLGLAYLNTGKLDESIAAFQKQLQINPSDEQANQYLGTAFEQKQDYTQAAAAFLRQTRVNPLDPIAHASLGDVLIAQHEYAAAVLEFEKATILAPRNAQLQESLGSAYAGAGKANEAVAAFEKAAVLSPSEQVLNAAAFDLAEHKLALDKAQRFSELAISDTKAQLQDASLAHITDTELNAVEDQAADWDTLGWVYFQKGNLDRALPYIRAAWMLSEDGEAGDHLAQIYERSGDKKAAIHACALALAAPHAVPDTRARLTLLLGGNSQIDDLVANAKPELEALRTIPAGKLLAKDVTANFLILLSPGEKQARVDAVRFLSGSEELRPFAARLRALDYGAVFPDSSPGKLIRRGTLACTAKTGECIFTLILPEDARPAQ